MNDGSMIGDQSISVITKGALKYGNINNRPPSSYNDFYWAAGPESGAKIDSSLYTANEPNESNDPFSATDNTLSDIQSHESCIMTIISNATLNDIKEGNYPDYYVPANGMVIEFGGYADGADPGKPDNSKKR